MRSAHFDVAGDGVLMYHDPMIGRYESVKFGHLVVRLSESGRCLELWSGSRVVSSFDLIADTERACMAASNAYFDEYTRLAGLNQPNPVRAAS